MAGPVSLKLLWGTLDAAAQRAKSNWEGSAQAPAPQAPAAQEKQYLRYLLV